LLDRAEKAAGQEVRMIDLPMSRMDIADYLGLTKETVSRMLASLKGRRIIRLDALDRVEVIDRRQLAGIAEGHEAV
jgi:CRP/FNR family transcriptional regulator, anaerobic regulatory protein